MSKIETVCVFCGSSQTITETYKQSVREFADICLKRDIKVVYGGANSGLMGMLADTILSGGGEVVGVIPEGMMENEPPHEGLTALHVTETKPKRKERMTTMADGFVALPGGIGTQEEVFTILGQAKHGHHGKPCGYLNVAGYYDSMRVFLDGAVEQGFISPSQRELLTIEDDPERLLDAFEAYQSPLYPD